MQILQVMRLIKKLLYLIFLLLLAAGLVALGYYFAVTKDAFLSEEKLLLAKQSITVYDCCGETVKTAAQSPVKQTARIEQIPRHTKQAFVDAEDKRFFKHNGFDVKRIGKAVLTNFKSRSFKQGASTISQQLIKNTHLTQEKTLKRKLREWKLTVQLEKKYTKDEILEKYLNTIYFGHNCFGLESAAEFYFGKSASELSLSDSALLAGLVSSPNNYSPFKNPEICQKRKEIVLKAMLKNGSINESEYQAAKEQPVPKSDLQKDGNGAYVRFVFNELADIANEAGWPLSGNVEIFTYLQPDLQSCIQSVLHVHEASDKLAMVLDVDTLGFKACAGTVGDILRSPASLIKPLLVYAPAFEENLLSPATPILDEEIDYNGYTPKNYDGKFHGYVSARECLEKSLNIPAVKTLHALTVNKGSAYLKGLGLPVSAEDETLALALGGMKTGFSLQNILSAYAAFPNGGNYSRGGFISEIRVNGQRVYKKNPQTHRVFSEETAYLTSDVLKGTAENGTAKKLRGLPFDIAAKTGTVGSKSGNTDAYALSFTARDCAAVWLGNADNTKIEYTGGGLPCDYLRRINEYLYEKYTQKGQSVHAFPVPKNVVRVTLDKLSYYDTHTLELADDIAPITHRFTELFKADNAPKIQSKRFSNPSIVSPTISVEKGVISIVLDKRSPAFYKYKIEKYDYVTHNTVYFGDYLPTFTDTDVQMNKSYIYTITPIYKGRLGTAVVLPAVTTKSGSPPPENPILDKDWWDY